MSAVNQPRLVSPAVLRVELLTDVTAKSERVAAAREETTQALKAKHSAHEEDSQEWQVAAAKARDALQPEPLAPNPPDTRSERSLLDQLYYSANDLFTEQLVALAAGKPKVQAEWDKVRPDFAREALEALAPLRDILGSVDEWWSLLRECRAAEEGLGSRRGQEGDSARMRQRLGILDLVDLADGVDVLKPAPPLATHNVAKISSGTGEGHPSGKVKRPGSLRNSL